MGEELLEVLEPLLPIDFFAIAGDIAHAKKIPTAKFFKQTHLLADTSELLNEEKFADIALAWNEEAIFVEAHFHKTFEAAFYPDYAKGDSLELFFDTRDLKTAGFATRFCHHFLILPQEVHGVRVQELTRFRTEDSHPLCDPDLISAETHFGKRDYKLTVVIPRECLHGFDPMNFDRLGFTYRCNRENGPPQHFSVSSDYFSIEQHPRFWASLRLIKD